MIIDGEKKCDLNEWNMQDEIKNGSFLTKQITREEITNLNENNDMEINLQTLHTFFFK
jgi:hypothetical protein